MPSVKDKLEQLKNGSVPEKAPPAAGPLQAGGKASAVSAAPPQPVSAAPAPPAKLAGGAKDDKATAPPQSSKPQSTVPTNTSASKSEPIAPPSSPKPSAVPAPKKPEMTKPIKENAKPLSKREKPSSTEKAAVSLEVNEGKKETPEPVQIPLETSAMGYTASETVQMIPTNLPLDFPGHPIKVTYNADAKAIEAKILRDGIQDPVLLWPHKGNLHIVSGHLRRFLCNKNGIKSMPCIIRAMTYEDAVIAMNNGNAHREIPITQQIKALVMEMEARKNQGARNDLRSQQGADKEYTELAEIYGARLHMSGRSFQRYMHIQYLSDDFCDMIDAGEMKAPVGIELSYLTKEQQAEVYNLGLDYDVVPTSAQAKQLHELSESGKWIAKTAKDILVPKHPQKSEPIEQPQKPMVFKSERIPLAFPPGTTMSDMENHILKMLELQKLAKRKQQEQKMAENQPDKPVADRDHKAAAFPASFSSVPTPVSQPAQTQSKSESKVLVLPPKKPEQSASKPQKTPAR